MYRYFNLQQRYIFCFEGLRLLEQRHKQVSISTERFFSSFGSTDIFPLMRLDKRQGHVRREEGHDGNNDNARKGGRKRPKMEQSESHL